MHKRIIKYNLLGMTMLSLTLMACSSNALATSSLSVSLSPTIDLELVPSDTSTTSQETTNLTISTNNTEGFRVLVNSTNTTSLINAHHSETIPTVTSPTTLTNLPTNTWALYLGATSPTDSSTFSPISLTPTELVHNELANASGTYKLAIGTKVDTSLPAGMYSNELVVSVVADPAKLFSGITYMQDMTPNICATADEHETTQLIDKRDGKSYWVAKLKDGNCWMTQNLALDITEEGLRAEDTDIEEDWNQDSQYPPKETLRNHEYIYETLGANTFSWDLGQYIVGLPANSTSCKELTNDISICDRVGIINISDSEWKPTFVSKNGDFKYPDGTTYSGYVAIDESNHTYDSHYLLGNFYQFNAATAGTGALVISNNVNAKGSICPKNWSLPTSGTNGFNTNGSLAYLLKQYNLATSYTNGVIYNNDYNVTKAPFYFTRSGYLYNYTYYNYGLSNASNYMMLLSKTSYNSGQVYIGYMYDVNGFNIATTYSSNGNRQHGASVRCRAMGI